MGQKTGDRYLVVAWSALGLILASGILRLFSFDAEDYLFGESLFDTDYGRTLFTMVLLWGVLVINGLIITFVLRPRLAGRASSHGSAAQAQQHQQGQIAAASWLTRLTRADLAIAFVIAFLGASLGTIGGVF
jgi:putative copper export protein